MASHSVYTFFSVWNCLDEEFDAPDAAADHDLCRAIMAGKAGMHPEAWDTRSQLTAVMPQGFHGYEWVPEAYRRPIARSAAAIAEQRRENTEWEARHRRRPVEDPPRRGRPPRMRLPADRKPGPKPAWHPHTPDWDAPAHGTLQLTCDMCERARFGRFVRYSGDRSRMVAEIRAMGHNAGWTCIAGTDRCPACSRAVEPNPVGNGAGGNQGDEQHA